MVRVWRSGRSNGATVQSNTFKICAARSKEAEQQK